MNGKTTIASAGNTMVPAHLALLPRGFAVRPENAETSDEVWIAENDRHQFLAADPVTLLGLVALHESRGEN